MILNLILNFVLDIMFFHIKKEGLVLNVFVRFFATYFERFCLIVFL